MKTGALAHVHICMPSWFSCVRALLFGECVRLMYCEPATLPPSMRHVQVIARREHPCLWLSSPRLTYVW